MKILHIPQRNIGLRKSVGGVKTILLEEIKWENKIEGIESKILIYDKIEENNPFFINKKSLKEDILDYNPDFVIFDSFWAIQHYFIAKFLKKNNIKYYIKPHGTFNRIAQKNSKFKFIKKFIARMLFFNNYVKNCDGLIFLNRMEQENSIYRKKFEVIMPNGIKEQDTNKNFSKKDNIINIIFLGRIDIFHKGLDNLLEVILQNKEFFEKNHIHFSFYGKGFKKDMKILDYYLSKTSSITKYCGVIYGDDKYKILNQNDIFILTSRFEGMPMGVLEALSLGIPCFVTKETCMGEWIEKYNCGFVNQNEKNLFSDLKKFIKIYNSEPNQYKENALKCANNFYWRNIIKEYERKYNKF